MIPWWLTCDHVNQVYTRVVKDLEKAIVDGLKVPAKGRTSVSSVTTSESVRSSADDEDNIVPPKWPETARAALPQLMTLEGN